MAVRIPWPNGAAWRQTIALEGAIYQLRARWNEIGDCWVMDIATRDNTPLVNGIKITGGVLLTARHADRRLPGGYFVVVSNEACGCTPGRDDMRDNARLIYVPAV